MPNLRTIQCYECEGSISLDKQYLLNLSDGKFPVIPVIALLSQLARIELVTRNLSIFDFTTYDNYLENDDQDSAYEYFINNQKCIDKRSFDVITFKSLEELNQYLKEEEIQL